jgi:hypothetical protein
MSAKDRLNLRNRRVYAKRAVRYLKAKSGCVICGNELSVRRLHYHHKDKKTKLFELAHIPAKHIGSWRYIAEEIRKCIVLCNNCHSRVHHILNTGEGNVYF